MLDISRIIILLLLSIILLELLQYDSKLQYAIKSLYVLIPFALILIIFYEIYHTNFMSTHTKKILRITTIILIILSIYLLLRTNSQYYPHMVYQTSLIAIWGILIVAFIIFQGDEHIYENIGILKIVLFIGLIASFIYWMKGDFNSFFTNLKPLF